MSKKPKGFKAFDALAKKLVKVDPAEVPKREPLKCRKCRSTKLKWNIYTITCKDCGHSWQFAFS